MCFAPKMKQAATESSQPEKTAEPDEIGATRKAEDDALFGGVPDLRVDRNAVPNAFDRPGLNLLD